jgi:hypothetical protein
MAGDVYALDPVWTCHTGAMVAAPEADSVVSAASPL